MYGSSLEMHYIMCCVKLTTAINTGLVTVTPCHCHSVENSNKQRVEDSLSDVTAGGHFPDVQINVFEIGCTDSHLMGTTKHLKITNQYFV